MTVKELKMYLDMFDDDIEVKFTDYDNGGGLNNEQMDILELHLLIDKKILVLG